MYVIVGGVVLMSCCGVTGILAAIAIPNFVKYQARAKQSDCKTHLKQLFIEQEAHRSEFGKYARTFDEVQFSPINSRYAYLLGDGAVLPPTHPEAQKTGLLEAIPANVRQSLRVTDEAFTVACAGNIDNDPAIDVWTISSEPRIIDGLQVPAGVPHNDLEDLLN